MHTRESEMSIGAATKDVASHASSIARLELRLAVAELKEKLSALGLGVGLALGALIGVLFAIGFTAATIAAALATTLATWLALLIVTAAFILLAAILGAIALRAIRRGTPPLPRQAIEEAKLATEAMKGNGSRAHD